MIYIAVLSNREITAELLLHRVRKKKRPEYFSHNFDKFTHSFVIFGTNNPDTSMY